MLNGSDRVGRPADLLILPFYLLILIELLIYNWRSMARVMCCWGGMGTIVIILCYCVHAEWERQSGETSRSFDSTIPFYLRILLELLIYYLEEYG